jgi:hypothetical protein
MEQHAATIPTESHVISLPANTRDFRSPASDIPPRLDMCSRSVPTGISGSWQPSQGQIDELESRLIAWLDARAKENAKYPPTWEINEETGEYIGEWSEDKYPVPPENAYFRQYVGIIVQGKRLIYGDFNPYDSNFNYEYDVEIPITIVTPCDGGPDYWGIVYNPENGNFEDIQFNGVA